MSLSLVELGATAKPPSSFCAATSHATVRLPGETPADLSASIPNAV